MPQQMQTNATTNANKCEQMPQQMQTNATTNANKCKQMQQQMQINATTNANKCRALRQKMFQTYVKLNVVTYVYLIFWGPDPSI